MTQNDPLSVTIEPPARCLVAMIDIRGFSAFANDNDPTGVANYSAMVTRYVLTKRKDSPHLAQAEVKPLGDGLLFILNFDSDSSHSMVNSTVEMLNELVDVSDEFPAHLESHRPAGVSSAPSQLGIGVAFGSIVGISSVSSNPRLDIHDYVGHPINLASRLQGLARAGGCVVHADVYEKILKEQVRRAGSFRSVFGQPLDVLIPNIGGTQHHVIYTTAQIPEEYLKSKVDEQNLEEFAIKSLQQLRSTYVTKRTPSSSRLQLPETTRFILFKKDESGDFWESVPFMVGQRMAFQNTVSIGKDSIKPGVCPVTDAIISREPVVVSYSVRYDECDSNDLDNQYWTQTLEQFPGAGIDFLRKLTMHPASILAIPLIDSRSSDVVSVAVFDSLDTEVFNEAIADEMKIRLDLLYSEMFEPQQAAVSGVLRM